jgi:hypothetical protein
VQWSFRRQGCLLFINTVLFIDIILINGNSKAENMNLKRKLAELWGFGGLSKFDVIVLSLVGFGTAALFVIGALFTVAPNFTGSDRAVLQDFNLQPSKGVGFSAGGEGFHLGRTESEGDFAKSSKFDLKEDIDNFKPAWLTAEVTASSGTYLVWSIADAVALLAIAATAFSLAKVGYSTYKGDPFVAANIKWFDIPAWAMVVGLLADLVKNLASMEMTSRLGSSVATGGAFSLYWVVAAVAFATLSAVWRRGVQHADENRLTV